MAVRIEVTLPISGGWQHTPIISTTLKVEAGGSQDHGLSVVVWTKLFPYRVRYSNTGFWLVALSGRWDDLTGLAGEGISLGDGLWELIACSNFQFTLSISHLRLKNIFQLPDRAVSCHVSPTVMDSPCETGSKKKKKSLPSKSCLGCGHPSQYHSSRKVNNALGYRSSRTIWAT